MFEAGKTYSVYLLSGGVRTFACVSVDGMTVRGSYQGGKEKSYKAFPRWGRLLDKEEGKEPSAYAIKINNRNGCLCVSDDEIKS